MGGSISNDRRVRDEFVQLLNGMAPEPAWQAFFARNPQALASGLPLKLEPSDILPLGRPGKSEPDFVIYPSTPRSLQQVGVVELKRPSTKILRQARRKLIIPSQSVQTAMGQLRQYDDQIEQFLPMQAALAFRMSSYLFMIVGRSAELTGIEAELQAQFRQIFSQGIQLLTFDQVLHNFEGRLLPAVPLVLQSGAVDRRYIPWVRLPILASETGRKIYHRLVEPPYGNKSDAEIRDEVFAQLGMAFERPRRMGWFIPSGQVGCHATESHHAAFAEAQAYVEAHLRAWEYEQETFEYLHVRIKAEGTFARLTDDDEAHMMEDFANITDSIAVAEKAISLGVDGFLFRNECSPGRLVVLYHREAIKHVEIVGKVAFVYNGRNVSEEYQAY